MLKIPLHSPHVPQFHVAHIADTVHAYPANHAYDSQILFRSMDNTPATAECFQNEGLAALHDHPETIPAPQLFRGLVRPRNCVLKGQQIRTRKRL
jgi:hypothetical protein